jgi:hypothetical protein
MRAIQIYRELEQSHRISSFGHGGDIDIFKIIPSGLRWFLIRSCGAAEYGRMLSNIQETIKDLLESSVNEIAATAENLGIPLLEVQQILYAERFATASAVR